MRRKPIATVAAMRAVGAMGAMRPLARVAFAAATWAATVVAVEALAESEIARPAHLLEEKIELRLQLMERGRDVGPAQESQPQPERSHEESIEPWELVGV
jgi:hypothetical protein